MPKLVPNERETGLVRACLELLQLRGFFIYRQNQGALKVADPRARYGYRFVRFAEFKGISDIIGATREGRYLAIECKIWPGKPTVEQRHFLDSVSRTNGIALVVYSIEQLDTWIRTGTLPPYRIPRRRCAN